MIDATELRMRIAEVLRFNTARSLGSAEPSRFTVVEEAGLLRTIDPARPGPYANRVIGFTPNDLQELDRIMALYEEAGCALQLDTEPDALTPELGRSLHLRGFRPVFQLAYLQARPIRRGGGHSAVKVSRWTAEHADAFLALLKQSGVRCDPETWALRRAHYCSERFRTFVAERAGQPCAWATLLVDAETAYFANAFTLPAHRDQGAHAALLEARLADAAELGLDDAWTDVEWNTISHRNCTRAGFKLLTLHTHWRQAEAE